MLLPKVPFDAMQNFITAVQQIPSEKVKFSLNLIETLRNTLTHNNLKRTQQRGYQIAHILVSPLLLNPHIVPQRVDEVPHNGDIDMG